MAHRSEVGGVASPASFDGGEALSEHVQIRMRRTEFGVGNLLRVGHSSLMQLPDAVILGIVEAMLNEPNGIRRIRR